MKTNETQDRLSYERNLYAERALEAIDRLRNELAVAAEAIELAADGQPARSSDFVPSAQRLAEVVEYGAAFRALWEVGA